ncbi:MAG: HAD-IC family P-type ATPase [Chromatiaceae bacterium]|jgi:H+-transporting ATPase|nr:HAD-IC family P-type ATPase [Chromatiaceae bacterium]
METVVGLYDTRVLDREFIHTHESAIVEMIEAVGIFAEVVPEDKYHIVDTLQKGGHIVAMTGDGVNDAPALKKADCGFAVSNATDAARAAADIILTASGLSVINHAIEQARITFERMQSYAIFRIAETVHIVAQEIDGHLVAQVPWSSHLAASRQTGPPARVTKTGAPAIRYQ